MKSFRLPNGIQVVTAPMKGTDVVTSLILFKVGSRNEQKKNNGVSHFVEHLFFKGTTNRPTTLAIAKELDSLGADYNAFTSKDHTGYYVKVAKKHTVKALEVLADILFHPLFDAAEIDRERGVIVEEINMYEDNPMATAEELAEELLFGKNHPLGFRIAGPKNNIRTISRSSILHYRDTYYHPANMVIICAGNLPSDTNATIRKYFGGVSQAQHQTPKHAVFTTVGSTRFHWEKKKTAQTHLALGFRAPSYTESNLLAAQLLAIIFGGNMSSRLFINVRERQGLCYYIRASVTPYEDAGIFAIQAGFDIQRIEKAMRAIVAEIAALCQSGITADELHHAKEYLRGKMSLRLEDTEEIASWWGRNWFFMKKMETPAQYLDRFKKITQRDIQQYIQTAFSPKQAHCVIIGPSTPAQMRKLQRILVW